MLRILSLVGIILGCIKAGLIGLILAEIIGIMEEL